MRSTRPLLDRIAAPFRSLARAHDLETEHGRSKERARRIYLSAITALGAKLVSFIALVVTVPMTLHHLGVERYGVWMTLTSFLALLSFADLGLGLGMINAVSHASGRNDPREMQTSISNTFLMLCVMASLLIVVSVIVVPLVPWSSVFNVRSPLAKEELAPTLLMMAATTAIAMPLGIVQRVQLGLQEGFLSNAWQIGGSVASLIAIVVAVKLGASLPWLVLGFSGAPLLVTLLNWSHFFVMRHPDLRPKLAGISKAWMVKLARVGIGFAVLQTGYQIAYSLDNVVIARVLGSDAVAEYAVITRLFSIVPMAAGLIAVPLWPAFGEAFTRGDYTWVKRTLKRATAITFLLALSASLILAAFSQFIVGKWAGNSVIPSFALAFGVAIWVSIDTVRLTTSDFFNSVGVIRFQIGVFFVYGAISLATKAFFASRYGSAGVVWAANLCYPVLFAAPTVWKLRDFFRRHSQSVPLTAQEGVQPL